LFVDGGLSKSDLTTKLVLSMQIDWPLF
jgi:hypothetical protein